MFIVDTLSYIFAISPDSYTPLNYSATIHFIIWLALSVFILEGLVMMVFQYLFATVDRYIPIDFLENITKVINSGFIAASYPFKYAELIRPFSSILYGIIYGIIILYACSVSIINMVLKHFTDRELDIYI